MWKETVVRCGYLPRGAEESHGLPPPSPSRRTENGTRDVPTTVLGLCPAAAKSGSSEDISTAVPVACNLDTGRVLA
jgi:hypothetical protein